MIKRGDIFWVNFDPSTGKEIQKKRPALICSNDLMNAESSFVIVIPVTSTVTKVYSFEYLIEGRKEIQGKLVVQQVKSLDKSRLGSKICSLSSAEMLEIDRRLKTIFALD
jgi:mRNA interferase MazF